MNKETIKELRERADEMITAGIANKDALFAALPVLTELQAKADGAKKNLAAAVKTLTMLSELCSRYALEHESVFEKKRLVTNQQGVRTGDIVLADATYHFASGYDGYVRNSPEKLTQDFLASLPEKWRKASLKLDVSGINEDGPTDEELAERGLAAKVRNVWSLVDAGEAAP